MDWIIIGAALVAGWAMLSVITGERLSRSQLIEMAKAKTAAEQARLEAGQIPIAMSSGATPFGAPAAINRKR